ncbi:MAG: hypothetical protein U0163_05030 [Gemmatimonadaceae bacterium]
MLVGSDGIVKLVDFGIAKMVRDGDEGEALLPRAGEQRRRPRSTPLPSKYAAMP